MEKLWRRKYGIGFALVVFCYLSAAAIAAWALTKGG